MTHRILDVFARDEVVVTLQRLVLTGGYVSTADPGDDEGGAVLADILHLTDVEIIDNRAVAGGAVSVAEMRAVRTSFVGNTAEVGVGQGGAVNASVSVVLENVTIRGNLAKLGGAVHMDLITGSTTDAAFEATFVTFLDSEASDASGGADVHLSTVAGVDLPIVLRGVRLGGVGADATGMSCAGTRFAATPVPQLNWTTSFVTDANCNGPEGSVIDHPTFTTVSFLTGTTALKVPEGAREGLNTVDNQPARPRGLRPTIEASHGLRVTRASATPVLSSGPTFPHRKAPPRTTRTPTRNPTERRIPGQWWTNLPKGLRPRAIHRPRTLSLQDRSRLRA